MKKIALEYIEKNKNSIIDVAKTIFNFAELSLEEHKSCQYYCDTLEKEGFVVQKEISGIQTAFSASFGEGKPIIGILAEYDALSGLSQEPALTYKKEITCGGNGHGCGHNLLGAGCFGAVLGIKKFLEETKINGTVVLFGCPGEEGGASKAFMARDGIWKNIDCAIAWHPSDNNEVVTGTSISCIQTQYTFSGVSSHASDSPELGRSALDAVELMNTGVQYLREHMPQSARIHYAITDSGGRSPNVVQSQASVLYMVRDIEINHAMELQERVDKIAQGAALMTGTTCTKKFIDALSNLIPNTVLSKLIWENLNQYCNTEYSNEEQRFAAEIATTYPNPSAITGLGIFDPNVKSYVLNHKKDGNLLNNFVIPLCSGMYTMPSSTDVGDVSWQCPTVTFNCTTRGNNAPNHSWQNVSFSGYSVGFKGVLNAAKTICATAIDLLEDTSIIEKAKTEFKERTLHGYNCPIPKDAVPTIAD